MYPNVLRHARFSLFTSVSVSQVVIAAPPLTSVHASASFGRSPAIDAIATRGSPRTIERPSGDRRIEAPDRRTATHPGRGLRLDRRHSVGRRGRIGSAPIAGRRSRQPTQVRMGLECSSSRPPRHRPSASRRLGGVISPAVRPVLGQCLVSAAPRPSCRRPSAASVVGRRRRRHRPVGCVGV